MAHHRPATALLAVLPLFAAGRRCLDSIYEADEPHNTADFEFDRTFAGDSEGMYSCILGMRPSAMRKALEQFQKGVLDHDVASINAVIEFPITAHVSSSRGWEGKITPVKMRNAHDWFAFQKKYFGKETTALVACASMKNVTPIGGRSQGVMIGSGTFWFRVPIGTHKVSMIAVNLSPSTSAKLARDCASQ